MTTATEHNWFGLNNFCTVKCISSHPLLKVEDKTDVPVPEH